MLKIIHHFFTICQPENRRRFHVSVWLTFLESLFNALKIAAIYILIRSALEGGDMGRAALTTLGVMLLSIAGSYVVRYFSMMLQTKGGYDTCARKRMEIAEHLRMSPWAIIMKRASARF